ncbi:MAG: peptide chain release factor N(5)-glutamine methyltransferase [Rhodothermales bacterium]
MTRLELLRRTTRTFTDANIDTPRRTAEWMLMEVLDIGRAHLIGFGEHDVSPEQMAVLEAMLARRLAHEPLQYILGYTDFYGLRIDVTPDVLIPRSETEQVVEYALARIADRPTPRVMDAGTGSGCIPLAIKYQRPDAEVWACDVSPEALAVARSNGVRLGLDIHWFAGDLLAEDFAAQPLASLDLLISNPPYVSQAETDTLAAEVVDHEPHLALFAAPDDPLIFYRALVRIGQNQLKNGGWAVFETHADYGEAVGDLLREAGYTQVAVKADYNERSRIAAGQKRG